ncbi:MAG: hypothetical protein PVJ64_04160 [Gemmatimonadales bacterium]|jgi:hypothetical protein
MPREEPQPVLKLDIREKPYQKITINRMSLELYNQLKRRADKLNKTVPVYCRVVLEHAANYRQHYKGPLQSTYSEDAAHRSALTIPLKDREFLEELRAWDPYGVDMNTKIALSILKKHLEVRTW